MTEAFQEIMREEFAGLRRRLKAVPGEKAEAWLLQRLRSGSSRGSRFAAEILVHVGEGAVSALVADLMKPRRTAPQWCRILGVLQRIGVPLPPGLFFSVLMRSQRIDPSERREVMERIHALQNPELRHASQSAGDDAGAAREAWGPASTAD